MTVRLGKIGYLNVLPIYHPLENGLVDGDFDIISGPPSALNKLMDAGELDISAASSIEYARHPEKYYLVPDIAIGSRGPVQSVLLLCRCPKEELSGKTILVSSQTHTSAALLQVLLNEWGLDVNFVTGDASACLEDGQCPEGILAIGDEALNLRYHEDYPYRVDLGEAWLELTGLPFIFGVWIVQRSSLNTMNGNIREACDTLIKARQWGTDNMTSMCCLAADSSSLNRTEMCSYFDGLVYEFGEKEKEGLQLFYSHLQKNGIIESVPEMKFLP